MRDKDAVNAAFMICEMFVFYKTRGISLLQKLDELYNIYGYCLNTLHSYEFDGAAGFTKMQEIMAQFHKGLDGLPKSDVLKYLLEDNCSVVVRPSGTELKLKTYISVSAERKKAAEAMEVRIVESLKGFLFRVPAREK